jgi:hypothetical protein
VECSPLLSAPVNALYYLEKWWGKQMLSPLGANFTHPRGQVHHWELTSPLKTGLSFLTSLQICRLLHQKVVWGSLKWSGWIELVNKNELAYYVCRIFVGTLWMIQGLVSHKFSSWVRSFTRSFVPWYEISCSVLKIYANKFHTWVQTTNLCR